MKAPRSLLWKFLPLMAVFVILQVGQLLFGIAGVSHLGEESSLINEAGKQRFRVLLLADIARNAVNTGSWGREERARYEALLADYTAFSERFIAFLGASNREVHRAQLGEAAAVYTVWRQELLPLLNSIDPSRPSSALALLARYQARVTAHLERLDRAVTILEQHTQSEAALLTTLNFLVLATYTALIALSLFLIYRFVIRQLHRNIEAAQAIAAGAYDRRVTVPSRDELGVLAEAFNRMAAAIEEKTRRLTAYNEVAATITSSLSADEVLDRIMRYGRDMSGARASCVVFYDAPQNRFYGQVTAGLSGRFVRNMAFRAGGLADQVFSTGSYVLSNDRPENRHKLSQLTREEGIRGFICLPLMSHATRLGVIYFYLADRDSFTDDEIQQLSTFSHLAASAIENARLYASAVEQSVTDALTGLPNRRQFDVRIAEEIERARRYGKGFSLMMLDIDHFKRINDQHGHDGGDAVLRHLGGILLGQVREVDFAARYGGEEFIFILPETEGPGARLVAERIRNAIAASPCPLPNGSAIRVTASIGIATYPICGDNIEELSRHADQALYVAKESGRNRVVLYDETLKAELERDPNRIAALLRDTLANIEPIVTAIATKAGFYRHHVREVEQAAQWLAGVLDLSAADREALQLASQLHDIGMVTIPDAVLSKHEGLSSEDWAFIRQHPAAGADMLEQVPALKHVASIVRHHHERFDGGGYPDGLTGEATPYLARVLALADAYVSMIADWPGHRAGTRENAVAALNAGAGTQFDPAIVKAFVQALEKTPPDKPQERSSATA